MEEGVGDDDEELEGVGDDGYDDLVQHSQEWQRTLELQLCKYRPGSISDKKRRRYKRSNKNQK